MLHPIASEPDPSLAHLRLFTDAPLLLASLTLTYPHLIQHTLRSSTNGPVRDNVQARRYALTLFRTFHSAMTLLKSRSKDNTAWAIALAVFWELQPGARADQGMLQSLGLSVHHSTLIEFLMSNAKRLSEIKKEVGALIVSSCVCSCVSDHALLFIVVLLQERDPERTGLLFGGSYDNVDVVKMEAFQSSRTAKAIEYTISMQSVYGKLQARPGHPEDLTEPQRSFEQLRTDDLNLVQVTEADEQWFEELRMKVFAKVRRFDFFGFDSLGI